MGTGFLQHSHRGQRFEESILDNQAERKIVGGLIPENSPRKGQSMADSNAPQPLSSFKPTTDDVNYLIHMAEHHPSGISILRDGEIDAVAALFQVHAFTVEAAKLKVQQSESATVSV